MIAQPTPLQWPAGFARTRQRTHGRFRLTFPAALKSLHAAMQNRGLARHEYVISSNLPLKNNGDPTPVSASVQDTGIAVYWKEKNKPIRVVACDQFWGAHQNLRALALTLEHLRNMERWGCTQLVEHIMDSGFALPGPGQTSTGTGDGMPVDVEPTKEWCHPLVTPDLVAVIYKNFAKKWHPDQGGSTAMMAQLSLAKAQADAWFAWKGRQR